MNVYICTKERERERVHGHLSELARRMWPRAAWDKECCYLAVEIIIIIACT